MTLRQKICESGAKTLREFLCTPCVGGDSDLVYVNVPVCVSPLQVKIETAPENIPIRINEENIKVMVDSAIIDIMSSVPKIKTNIKDC